nr:EOG090X0GHI [Lepidurus arcticus]
MSWKYGKDLIARLPEHYLQFLKQWKYGTPAPVHYIPEQGRWKRDPETGEIKRIENIPIPLQYPKEFENVILGGEAVIKGFRKPKQLRRRVPYFWVPSIKRSVIHSEILGKYYDVLITDRAMDLIDQHHGFDNYILKTPAQDLKSLMEIRFKRQLLLALAQNTFLPESSESKRQEILAKYKEFVIPREEAEWYGLTLSEAIIKLKEQEAPPPPQPLKHQFRKEFIKHLESSEAEKALKETNSSSSSWLPKFSLFSTKQPPS